MSFEEIHIKHQIKTSIQLIISVIRNMVCIINYKSYIYLKFFINISKTNM